MRHLRFHNTIHTREQKPNTPIHTDTPPKILSPSTRETNPPKTKQKLHISVTHPVLSRSHVPYTYAYTQRKTSFRTLDPSHNTYTLGPSEFGLLPTLSVRLSRPSPVRFCSPSFAPSSPCPLCRAFSSFVSILPHTVQPKACR